MDFLRKALTTSNGADLLPYDLDNTLSQELLNLQPLTQMLNIVPAGGLTHEYRKRTGHPKAWFEGETTPANAKNGSYTRKTVQTKIQRIWGSVTGFAQAASKEFVDALATELEGSLQGMSDLLEFGAMFGASTDIGLTGDAYQYTGILPYVYTQAVENVIDAGGSKITLDMLDQVLAKAAGHRQTRTDPGYWLMGLRMKQVVDGLQTKVQIPLRSMELYDGKLVMGAYAGRGIYETDYLVPDTSSSSPTLTGVAAADGDLEDANYAYKIASVTMYGEQVASAATNAITCGTGDNTVNLSWTADASAVQYMIFRQDGGTGEFNLIDIIPALTYDSNGTVNGVVESYVDDGSKSRIDIEPLASGEQSILYVNANPERGASFIGLVDDMGRPISQLIRFVELARVKDTYDYMLKGYMALRLKYPETIGVLRHVKTA